MNNPIRSARLAGHPAPLDLQRQERGRSRLEPFQPGLVYPQPRHP